MPALELCWDRLHPWTNVDHFLCFFVPIPPLLDHSTQQGLFWNPYSLVSPNALWMRSNTYYLAFLRNALFLAKLLFIFRDSWCYHLQKSINCKEISLTSGLFKKMQSHLSKNMIFSLISKIIWFQKRAAAGWTDIAYTTSSSPELSKNAHVNRHHIVKFYDTWNVVPNVLCNIFSLTEGKTQTLYSRMRCVVALFLITFWCIYRE